MKKISLQAKAVLDAREKRYSAKQQFMQIAPSLTCIESSMNVPGLPKTGRNWQQVFKAGLQLLETKIVVIKQACRVDKAGYYALLSTETDVYTAKHLCCDVEKQTPWGRLLDLDCIGPEGRVSRRHLGLSDRLCMVCQGPQDICLRKKTHPLKQSRAAANQLAAQVNCS